MLDAYIIDAIHRAEIERLREEERRRLRLELPIERPRPEPKREETTTPEMGDPIVIPLIPPSIDDAA